MQRTISAVMLTAMLGACAADGMGGGGGATRAEDFDAATRNYVACGLAEMAKARHASASLSDDQAISAAIAACRATGYEAGRHLMLEEADDVSARYRQTSSNIENYALPILEADLRRYLRRFLKETSNA